MKAILFPGQGSQTVGMAKDHFDSDSQFKKKVEQADSILGYNLSEIMFNGPMEKLTETRYTQPAIFLHSIALFEKLGIQPDVTAGHSLGEFSALTAAGVIDFQSALELVSLRGELMQKAGETNPGTMAAIIGMDDETVDEICDEASKATGKPVVPANYNCEGQLVISGDIGAVEKAVDLAKEKGCRLAKVLSVSGAFHSPLMKPAYDGLKNKLDETGFSDAQFPVYSNYTAEPSVDAETLKSNVLEQLLNPVRWTQTMLNMGNNGVTHYIEIGPGKVLQGLVKRTHRKAEIDGHE
ncbi:MAG: ACP S-malonyltransferase [Balneolaceae bacterium]|nr:ACP S-malonyltransferase [Balneolaceae bacterium]